MNNQVKDEPTTITGWMEYVGKTLYPQFNLDDPIRRKIYQESYIAISGRKDLQMPGIDPAKGMLICGSIGVGKTALFLMMQRFLVNTPMQFVRTTAPELSHMLEDPERGISYIMDNYGKSLRKNLFIDDVGYEEAKSVIKGRASKMIADLLYQRHELFIFSGFRTHISTGIIPCLKPEEEKAGAKTLRSIYGEHVYSRLLEMNNYIEWNGNDLRNGNKVE